MRISSFALSLVAMLVVQPASAAHRQAKADSLLANGSSAVTESRGPRRPLPPTAALGIGLGATAIPTMMAYGMTSRDTKAENISLFVGLSAGIVAGPAVGLWSGGRGDLARSGLVIRSVCTAICLGGAGGASSSWENGSQDAAVLLGILSVAGGIGATMSVFHDLAITPSATGEARRRRVGLVVRPDGGLALNMQF